MTAEDFTNFRRQEETLGAELFARASVHACRNYLQVRGWKRAKASTQVKERPC